MIRVWPGCLLTLLLLACGRDEVTPVPNDALTLLEDTYIQVMAELSDLKRRPPPARIAADRERLADSVRTQILEAHGVTPEELLTFSEIVGRNPARMQLLAERIAEQVDTIAARRAREDSVRLDTAAPDSVPTDSVGTDSLPAADSAADSERVAPQPREQPSRVPIRESKPVNPRKPG